MNGYGLGGYVLAALVLARACAGLIGWSLARPGGALAIDRRNGRVRRT